jgi:hypothetical protein
VDGDQVTHLILDRSSQAVATKAEEERDSEGEDKQNADEEKIGAIENPDPEATAINTKSNRSGAKAIVTVNVALDSTMDADKLEKQLALLRKYGAI